MSKYSEFTKKQLSCQNQTTLRNVLFNNLIISSIYNLYNRILISILNMILLGFVYVLCTDKLIFNSLIDYNLNLVQKLILQLSNILIK